MKELNYVRKRIKEYKLGLLKHVSHKPHDIQKALIYLNEHLFNTDCSVHTMKKCCNITAQNFSSRFRNYIGVTPREYIVYHRIELAKRLLIKEKLQNLPVNSIGFYLGYEKPSAFSTRFKKKTGVSPNRWRRKKSVKSEEKRE